MVQSHDNGRQAAAQKPAAPAVRTRNEANGFHGEAYSHFLRKKHGPDNYMDAASEQDHIDAKAHAGKKFSEAAHSLVQAGHFGNHDEARDYLDSTSGRHLHNEAGDGDVSKVGWVAKDVKNKKTVQAHHEGQASAAKGKQQAQAAARKNPSGYQPPKPGDTGHDEHTKYGVYFRKGDKVKDAWGDRHEVISHNGAEVLTNHGTLHPTKLSHDTPGAHKPMPDHVQKMVSDVAQSSAKPEHKKAAIDAIVAQHAGGAPSTGAKKITVRASVAKKAAAKTGSAAPPK